MFEKTVQPAFAFAVKDFFDTLRSPRFLTVSILLGILLIGSGAGIAVAMAGSAAPGQPGAPDPFEIWFNGSNGALVGLAFGLTPVLLPFLPVLVSSRALEKDRRQGVFQLSLTKAIPPWGPALGKFAGMYGAVAIPTLAMTAGAAVGIQAIGGTPIDGGLFASYVAGSVLLVGLYLLLTLLVGALVTHELVFPVVVLAWLGFNAIRQTGFFITARLATILGAKVATTFQVAWTDLVTFTGLYEGFMAPSVPGNLGFVIPADPAGPLGAVAVALPWTIVAWFFLLLLTYAIALRWIAPRRSARRA